MRAVIELTPEEIAEAIKEYIRCHQYEETRGKVLTINVPDFDFNVEVNDKE